MKRFVVSGALIGLAASLAMSTSSSAAPTEKPITADPAPFNYVSADVKAKMAAQRPLVAAAVRLQQVIDKSQSSGFTAISLGTDRVDLYWKGAIPRSVRTAVTKEQSVHVAFRPARYSRVELKAAEKKFMAYVVKNKGPVFGVRVPADGSGLVAQSRVAQSKTAVAGLRKAALPDSGVAIRSERAVAPVTTARNNDTSPFYGGGVIGNPGGGRCSTGFAVSNGSQQFILTAGHCGYPGGTFTNGDGSRVLGQGAAENVGHDILLIRTAAAGRIFDGGGLKAFETRAQFTKAVSGWAPTFPNEWICQSGMMSGAVCNIQNTSNFSYSYANGSEVYSDLVLAGSATGIAVRGGDSGGPVFTLDGSRVTAKGTVSGQIYYPLQLVYNGKCLDADANHLGVNGTRIQLWTCNGSTQQAFAFRGDGSIVSATSGGQFCLDADLNTIGTNGTKLQLWTCNSQAQQRWNYGGQGTGDIRSAYNGGKCIDADLNTIGANGTKMQLWDCNGQRQQLWNVSSRVMYQDFVTANRDFGVTALTAS